MSMGESVKDALKLLQASDNAEFLKSYIAIEKEFRILTEEIKKLEEENQRLRDLVKINANLYVKDNAYHYYLGETEKGPYCMKCYDDEKKLITMYEDDNGTSSIMYKCPKCKNSYLKRKYTTSEVQKVVTSVFSLSRF